MGVDETVGDVVAEVGLWWPAADEDGLRAAAAAWQQAAVGLDRAGATVGGTATTGTGLAAESVADGQRRHGDALRADAAACRALAAALLRYAEAVAAAKDQVVELAVTAGATLVAGAGLAWLTFGASAAAAGAVSAGLVAAAEAVGVELSATAASIVAGAVTGAAFGAVEAAALDAAVAQPLRVEAFGDGGYSPDEVAGAAVSGGVLGGVLGGGLARPAARVVHPGGTGGLAEIDAAITAALDPARRGALGPLFRPGVHESAGATLAPGQLPAARLLGSEGRSVHPPPRAGSTSGVLVRSSPTDRGRLTELVAPDAPTVDAVENTLLEASGRLARDGDGDVVLDGRAVGLSVETAGQGLVAAVERAIAQRLDLPDSIRFVFDDRSIHYP